MSRVSHIRIPVPLDGQGRKATIEVPWDITPAEAAKVAAVVSTLGTDHEDE